MKKSEMIYRRAARLIEQEESKYSCCAVAKAAGCYDAWNLKNYMPTIIVNYIETFADDEHHLQNLFEGDRSEYDPQDLRILALCFMAASVA